MGPGSGPGQRNAKRLCRLAFALVAGVGFMRFAHGLRNGVAIAPAEQAPNTALTKTNKKGPARGPELQLCV
jgi:hypothetical protein